MSLKTTRFGMVTISRRYFLYCCVVAMVIVFALNNVGNIPSTRYRVHYQETSYENPSIYLQSKRFDVIVKMVYAFYYVHKSYLPETIREAYLEHLRVWNHFKEQCSNIKKDWFDRKIPCKNKRNQSDFVSSFHKTIDLIKEKGFDSSISKIPLDISGFLMNGAHRISASIVLSKNVSFEHHNYKQLTYCWDYKFFRSRGMSHGNMNMVVLEWMKIQMTMPYLKNLVYVVSVFSNDDKKDMAMRSIIKKICSMDARILYEVGINFTRTGIKQLVTHMYGLQPWVHTKIEEMLSKSKSTYRGEFFFVFIKDTKQLVKCRNEIQKLYNDKDYNSTAHVQESMEANLILAEMVLNANSLQFMNYAKNPTGCSHVANEMARRLSNQSIESLPGIYMGNDDVIIDSRSVLGIFGIRKLINVGLIFLYDNVYDLRWRMHGIDLRPQAFINNSRFDIRTINRDLLNEDGSTDRWSLFYDPNNFGYCYGIKFISLKMLLRYKKRQNEMKDVEDFTLINAFQKSIKSVNSY